MKGPAGRPSDVNRDPERRPGREPEHASFAVTRIGGRSRWSPVVMVGFVAVLTGMVGVAVGSRAPAQPPVIPPVALVATGTPPAPTATPTPVRTSDADQIQLQTERHPGSIFVHGDVYVASVTWVFVSLQDIAGHIAGWASVSVPGAAGPGVGTGPTLRFDVQLALPAEFSGPLSLQANAYDTTGRIIGSTRVVIPG